MDIDNFKSVNDTLGHAGGDEALKLLADTMRLVFGTHVLMARFGGDEFVLCIQTVIRRVFRHSWINWSEARVRHLHMAGVQCRCLSAWCCVYDGESSL